MSKCCKLIIVCIVLFCNSTNAQRSNWTLGFRMGWKGEVLEKTMFLVNPDFNIKTAFVPSLTTLGLDVTYNINKNFSITSGVGLSIYNACWTAEEVSNKPVNAAGNIFFVYIPIPLNVKYAIPLGKSNFSVYGKMGVSFDILVEESNTFLNTSAVIFPPGNSPPSSFSPYFYIYEHTAKVHNDKVNVLLNAGVGFSYRFKKGLGLFIEGEYYAGLRTIGHVFIDIKQKRNGSAIFSTEVIKEYQELLLIKGSYWNCSLGISYTFKKKEKKE